MKQERPRGAPPPPTRRRPPPSWPALALLVALTACQAPAVPQTVVLTRTPQLIVATARPSATAAPQATFTPAPPTQVLEATTWRQVAKFVEDDHTNWNQWDGTIYGGSYVCAEFAIDLVDHAQAAGLRAGLVHVEWAGNYGGHAFVWFDTTDKGRMWIEPQTDYAYVRPIPRSTTEVREGTRYSFPAGTILQDVRGYYWEPYVEAATEIDPSLTWRCTGAPDLLCQTVARTLPGG